MMSQLSPILRSAADNGLRFWCPACQMAHRVQVGEGAGPRWGWNDDVQRPTFTPSVLVHYDHWVPPARFGEPAPKSQTLVKDICHSFVTDGRIQYLSDCTHALAGQTVDLPPWGDGE